MAFIWKRSRCRFATYGSDPPLFPASIVLHASPIPALFPPPSLASATPLRFPEDSSEVRPRFIRLIPLGDTIGHFVSLDSRPVLSYSALILPVLTDSFRSAVSAVS